MFQWRRGVESGGKRGGEAAEGGEGSSRCGGLLAVAAAAAAAAAAMTPVAGRKRKMASDGEEVEGQRPSSPSGGKERHQTAIEEGEGESEAIVRSISRSVPL
jgi:hypothetical protein